MSREFTQKMLAIGITVSLIALIFFVFTPSPSIAVHLNPGTPDDTSVTTATTITFNNVNLTIRDSEAIPVDYLNFSIRKSSDNSEVAYVRFSIQGTEISDPSMKFTVTPITNTSNLSYQESGGFGYDERTGWNDTFDYGYGPDTTDLTILYRIRYTTSTTGTFYAQLYVNSTIHTYASGLSTSFTVSTKPSTPSEPSTDEDPTARAGGPYTGVIGTPVQFDGSQSVAVSGTTITSYSWLFGDGTTSVGIRPTHTYTTAATYTIWLTVTDSTGTTDTASTIATISSIETLPTVNASVQLIQNIILAYGVTLEQPFYGSDTNGDGIVDVFTDPNNVLTPVSFANISGHACFLISTNNDDIPEFFWDTATNTITPLTHAPAPLGTPFIDTTKKTVTIEISTNKSGWIYLEITDQYPIEDYPQYTLTIKAGDRTISPDRIWRKNGKVYILDDPAIFYDLIYGYTILHPSFSPASGATVALLKPTITITYPDAVYIVTALFDTDNIIYQLVTTDNKVFTYYPTTDLTEGTHTLHLTVQDDQGINTLTSTATYTISLPEQLGFEFPWLIVIIIAIIIIIIGLIIFYLRTNAFI